MKKNRNDSIFWGILLLIIGTLFLLDNLGYNLNIWHIFRTYWPLILIFIGIKNILYHMGNKK